MHMAASSHKPTAAGPRPGDTSGGPRYAAWIILPIVTLQVVLTICGVLLAALARSASSSLTLGFALDDLGQAITILAFPAVGAFIFWRRPKHPIGWLFCATTLGWAIIAFAGSYAMYALVTNPGSLPDGKLAAWLFAWPQYITLGLLVLLFLLFPDGTLLSPRWRPLAWTAVGVAVVGAVASALAPGQIPDIEFEIDNPLGVGGLPGQVFAQLDALVRVPLGVALIVAAVISLALRQRRASGQERQQLKWFTSSVVMVAITGVAWAALAAPYGWQSSMPTWAEGINVASLLSVVLIPVSAGIAILKYHLYDIDLLINRTLVYGLLTALLVGGYFGTILLLARIGSLLFEVPIHALTGQKPTLAVVATTLAIAALFNPLRRRIQSFVDRRFYRNKYDARKTLEAFSVKLRDETNLDALSEDLVGVVRETMQPAHISLWLHPDPILKEKKKKATIRESGHHH
jgi:hypothetical protein